ncbi:hypothetical protein L5515_019488 [Caenorhabditis briggsae]|uniref:Uncharacterized protein n=1 Tax=Caenorhabditis briggsae TaxID=6238 RepID=A0AAE9FPK3_CAEBR|nr:hypothetical protein L5515_019488 [Caenorhabditis briggsae]
MWCCLGRREENQENEFSQNENAAPQAAPQAAEADPDPADDEADKPGIFVVGELPRAAWEPPREQIKMGSCASQNAVRPAPNNDPPAAVANLAANGAQQFAVIHRVLQVGDAQPAPNWQPRPQAERRAGTPRAPNGRQRNYVVVNHPAPRPMPQDVQID